MRYMQLLDFVAELKPKAILEIGTWNGERAQQMLNLAHGAKYYGFDLFEDATVENDRAEMNVKPHYMLEQVEGRLTGFDAVLYKGNTRETLATFNEPVDFVWIDGGHSVETIRSDWENVKRVIVPGGAVFFDDYYSGPVDTTRFGCNSIVAELKHEVLPDRDPIKGGGWVQMVRVWP